MQILFIDGRHEQLYSELCTRMKYLDEYHRTTAYLLSLDNVCRDHIADIFDLQEDVIKPETLCRAWQTSTSRKSHFAGHGKQARAARAAACYSIFGTATTQRENPLKKKPQAAIIPPSIFSLAVMHPTIGKQYSSDTQTIQSDNSSGYNF